MLGSVSVFKFAPVKDRAEPWHTGAMAGKPKSRPRDPNQLAKLIVDIAAGEAEDTVSESKRNPSKRRAGGVKGGTARATKLTSDERQEIARLAAQARWRRS